MSSYLDIFLDENKRDGYIMSFSRSHPMYDFFNDTLRLSYGTANPYDSEDIVCVLNTAREAIKQQKQHISMIQEEINFVQGMQGSIAEKMEQFYNLQNDLHDAKQELENYENAGKIIETLSLIMETRAGYDNHYIFVGIEVPFADEEDKE